MGEENERVLEGTDFEGHRQVQGDAEKILEEDSEQEETGDDFEGHRLLDNKPAEKLLDN